MNQQQVVNLQRDIEKVFNEVKSSHPETKELINKNEQELKKKYFSNKQSIKEKQKDRYEEVKKLLQSHLREPRENVVVTNESELVNKNKTIEEKKENAKNLVKAINFSKNVGVRYSFLLGNILSQIYNKGIKDFHEFIKDISYNADYCRFLVKFYKLLNMYGKLQNTDLPIRFFKTNYIIIKDICKGDEAKWKEG